MGNELIDLSESGRINKSLPKLLDFLLEYGGWIITVFSLISALPLIRPPYFFMIANYKELKKIEVFKEINRK